MTPDSKTEASRLQWKTRLFAIIVILTNSVGNLFIFLGMRHVDDVTKSPLTMIAAIFQPQVAIGIVLLITWLLTRMMMMSWADLTYVLPITAFGYVVSALLGWLFLSEIITPARWVGTLLIVMGTVLVGLGSPHASDSSTSGGGA
ncbi:MAG: EamA family transporter [Acidobacteriota bacterium]